MQNTSEQVVSMNEAERKKKFLRQENNQLREQLQIMSQNVNKVLEIVNRDALKKKSPSKLKGNKHSSIDDEMKQRAVHQENMNIDKQYTVLQKEHVKLKKRLEEV